MIELSSCLLLLVCFVVIIEWIENVCSVLFIDSVFLVEFLCLVNGNMLGLCWY